MRSSGSSCSLAGGRPVCTGKDERDVFNPVVQAASGIAAEVDLKKMFAWVD